MEGDMQIGDLDEALLVLSLKNDEISNLKSSIKTTEKKTSLKMTDMQFRIEQEKARTAQFQRKLFKAQDNAKRTIEQLQEQLKKAQQERHKQAETMAQMQVQARKKQRQFKASLFQCQLHLQRQKELSARLSADLQLVHRHFDPKKILSILQKKSLQEIPSYMQIYKRGLQKTELLRQAGLQMQRLRSQTYLSIEESFRKLSSYEAVMESLSNQNKKLQQSVQQKEEQLQLNTLEIEEKKHLLEAVKEQANSEVQILSDELHTLRNYYKQQHLKEEEQQGQSYQEKDYQRMIEELQLSVQEKEAQLQHLQSDYQQRLVQLQQENTALRNDIIGVHISALVQKEDFQTAITVLRRQLAEKEELIILLNNSIKEQQEFFEEKQKEFDRHIADLSELLRRKKRAQEESRESEKVYKMQIEGLSNQLEYLKHQMYARKSSHDANSEQNNIQLNGTQQEEGEDDLKLLKRVKSGADSFRSQGEKHNLLADLGEGSMGSGENRVDIGHYEQQPIWSDLYYALLQKHNQFAKRVQARLQAMTRRTAL